MKRISSTERSIHRDEALKIAKAHCERQIPVNLDRFHIDDKAPSSCVIYKTWPDEPCWYVICPWNDGYDLQMLRSSRIIVISKKTGNVLYDGSAHDEG